MSQRGCDSIVYTDLVLIDREDITCSFPYDTDPHRLSDSKFMSIWPNPTSGNITLEILDESRIKSEITVYNVERKLLHKQTVDSTHSEINMSGFSNGVYYLVLQSGRNILVEKIVKI